MPNESQWPKTVEHTLTQRERRLFDTLVRLDGKTDINDRVARERDLLSKVLLRRNVMGTIDGKGKGSLKESMETFLSPHGVRIVTATFEGVGYKSGNEDRVAVNMSNGFVAVIDGIGGAAGGDLAAEALAEKLIRDPLNIQKAIESGKEQMMIDGLGEGAGACVCTASVLPNNEGKLELNAWRAGDVRLIVIDEQNGVVFESEDENLVDRLVREKLITQDEAYFHPYRSVVTNSIGAEEGEIEQICTNFEVRSGQKIILMTDGITDNIETGELLPRIAGKSGGEIVGIIDEVVVTRMRNKTKIIADTPDRLVSGAFSDGFKLKPKPDNCGIAVVEIL